MQLSQSIQHLLFEHECVTIPRFGAFITRSINISIKNDVFYPHRKEVTFNALLVTNDGILAHYFAQKEKISFEQALRLIDKEVSSWRRKLQTQALIFPGVGEIRLNDSRKMEFTPSHQINFDTKAFGLELFSRSPQIIKLPNDPKFNIPMDDKEKVMFTLDNKEPKKQPLLKYAAIAVLGIGLVSAIYYFGDQYVLEQQAKQTEIAQNKIKGKIQNATFDLGALAPIELDIKANESNAKSSSGTKYYSVIAGSFRSKKNAVNLQQDLISQGYSSEVISVNEDGLYRVAYSRFTSKREAINLLLFIRNDLKEDAWYLIER